MPEPRRILRAVPVAFQQFRRCDPDRGRRAKVHLICSAWLLWPRWQDAANGQIDDIPYEPANALLPDHAELMHARVVGSGGPDFDHAKHIRFFWEDIDQCLYLRGWFYLVSGAGGRLIGTGTLRNMGGAVGEMTHLYVVSEARKTGLGRALVQQRLQDARDMGFHRVQADTFKVNPEMPAMYEKLGFKRVAPKNTGGTVRTSSQLHDHINFIKYEF
jgi:GNAT superfamily N-acetyltransferase